MDSTLPINIKTLFSRRYTYVFFLPPSHILSGREIIVAKYILKKYVAGKMELEICFRDWFEALERHED